MSRARDLADAGSKANYLDNVSADINTTYAPLASPDFTGTVDLTGTTLSLDNDQISGDKISGGTIGAGTFSGTIGSSVTFPKGSFTNYSVIVERETGSVTSRNYYPSGTGFQIVKHNIILPITADSAFTTDILSLSSNTFTLRTGYYYWRHSVNMYDPRHWHHFGLLTYGDSSGSGSSTSNITNDNVNYGSTFNYAHYDGIYLDNSGVVKVTSQNQKYGFYISIENRTYAGTSAMETYNSSTHHGINTKGEFFRIGDV